MRITEAKVFPVTGKNDLLAYANIIIDDCICVREIKIRRDATGFKIHMPQVKLDKGKYRDIAFARDYATRKMIEDAVTAEYEKVVQTPRRRVRIWVNRAIG